MIFIYNRKSLFERANYSQTLVKLAPPPSLDRRSSDECCSAAVPWRDRSIRNERGGAEEKLRWAHKQKSDKAGDSLQFTPEPTSHESCSDPEWSDTTYVEKIGRYSEEHHEPFQAFLDSRSAKSAKDGWTLPEVNVAFQKYIDETRRFDERRPDLNLRQMGLRLDARSRQKPPRGEASRFFKKDSKWHISPPLSYREDRTLPPGKTLISRKEKARLEALAAQVPPAVAASWSAAGGRFAIVEEERVPRSPNSERGEK